MTQVRLKLLLWILPLIFLLVGLSFSRAKFANDPDYIYLLNALNIIKLQPVGHIDNPGTTVMELGAVSIWITYLFDSTTTEDVVSEVLKNPDKYIEGFGRFLVLITAFILLLAGRLVLKESGNMAAALLIQLSPFLSATILDHAWTKTSPEPVLLSTVLVLSLMLVFYLYDENKKRPLWYLLFALITGFGLATKATYLPLALIPLILLPVWKHKLLYSVLVVPSFLLFTFPAFPEFKNMYNWYYNLLMNKGMYGGGETGFIDFESYFSSFRDIFRNNKVFTAMLLLSAGVIGYALSKKTKVLVENTAFRLLIAILVAAFASVLIVSKHYYYNHYLLPALVLTGLGFFVATECLTIVVGNRKNQTLLQYSIVSVLLIYVLAWIAPRMHQSNYHYKAANIELEETNTLIHQEFSDYKKVYYYPTSLHPYSALMFGNVYSKSRNLMEIKDIYPEVIFYNRMSHTFNFWLSELSLAEIVRAHGAKILLVGGPLSQAEADEISGRGFPLKAVYIGRSQALFVLDSTQIDLYSLQKPDQIVDSLLLDMETLSDDKEYFGAEGAFFKRGGQLSTEQSFSGVQSLLLDKHHAFGLEHLMDVLPGEKYRISVWRQAANNDGCLVAASSPEALFYQQSCDFSETGEKGWRQLRLEIRIPENFGSNQLKLYVWNSGRDKVFFDDLLIEKLD